MTRTMDKISRDSLMTLEAYAKARKDFRTQVIAHKKSRTVHLGDHLTLLFEDAPEVSATTPVRPPRLPCAKAHRAIPAESATRRRLFIPLDGRLSPVRGQALIAKIAPFREQSAAL